MREGEPVNHDLIEEVPEGALPSEIALFLIAHIDNPCKTEVAPGVFANIRDFYIRLGEEALPDMEAKNPDAAEALRDKINEYKKGTYIQSYPSLKNL